MTPDPPSFAENTEQVPVPPLWDTHLGPRAAASLRNLSALNENSLVELSCVLHRNHQKGNSCRPGLATVPA